jgi:predicted acylesterase/phospholipase RssA
LLLASAAIPGLFPPVLVDVETPEGPRQEMHVDGGAVAQLFLYPGNISVGNDLRDGPLARRRRAWVIRNARLDADWAAVRRNIFTIMGRAVTSMIHYAGSNDILRIQATTQRDGVDFNLAYIGADFALERGEQFDTAYMRALFDYAYRQARAGYRWAKGHPLRLGAPVPLGPADAAARR